MNNYVLLDQFLCVHLFIAISSCKYGSWHMIFICKCRDAILLSGEACHRLDSDCKRSKKGMLLFHYVIYSPLS